MQFSITQLFVTTLAIALVVTGYMNIADVRTSYGTVELLESRSQQVFEIKEPISHKELCEKLESEFDLKVKMQVDTPDKRIPPMCFPLNIRIGNMLRLVLQKNGLSFRIHHGTINIISQETADQLMDFIPNTYGSGDASFSRYVIK